MIQHCDACASMGHHDAIATHMVTKPRAITREVARVLYVCEKCKQFYWRLGWSTISLALLWKQEQEHAV